MNLSTLRPLGRSGLLVSPFALGAMTFGTQRWGSSGDVSEAIFNAYIDAGGNFIDTADVYAGGRSESLTGSFIEKRGLRDRLVLATKYGFSSEDNNALAGGSGRKNLHRALEGSLRRLGTNYVDLYWMHVWDRITPPEEVLQSLVDLVRAGKIRYFGFSDVPAWFTAYVASLAKTHGVPGPVALQMEYSLVERTIEQEHFPAARELGMGIVPWSPLAGGFLAGKYPRDQQSGSDEGRLSGSNPFGSSKFTERNWNILETLREVAGQTGYPLTQVALAWVSNRAGVASVLLGVRTPEQLTDNLQSLAVTLPPAMSAKLDSISALAPAFPYSLTDDVLREAVFGGADIVF